MTKNEKILKRALEMAVKNIIGCDFCSCDLRPTCRKDTTIAQCHEKRIILFIRKAKEELK